jgi:SHS2 domain-containing protein
VNAYKMSNTRSSNSAGFHPPVAFEEIEHTADRALRIYGSNLEELLLNAARGMNSLMVAKHVPCLEHQEKFVELDAMDSESLLVDWLSELAYWAEIEMLVFHEFKIDSVSPTHLRARIYGRRVTQLEKHIKAVTYHNLDIVQTEKGFTATVVFDV